MAPANRSATVIVCGAKCQLRRLKGIAQLVAEQNKHCRRREDLGERCGGRNRACGQGLIVTVAKHGRQHDQAHGDGRGADHAFGRR